MGPALPHRVFRWHGDAGDHGAPGRGCGAGRRGDHRSRHLERLGAGRTGGPARGPAVAAWYGGHRAIRTGLCSHAGLPVRPRQRAYQAHVRQNPRRAAGEGQGDGAAAVTRLPDQLGAGARPDQGRWADHGRSTAYRRCPGGRGGVSHAIRGVRGGGQCAQPVLHTDAVALGLRGRRGGARAGG